MTSADAGRGFFVVRLSTVSFSSTRLLKGKISVDVTGDSVVVVIVVNSSVGVMTSVDSIDSDVSIDSTEIGSLSTDGIGSMEWIVDSIDGTVVGSVIASVDVNIDSVGAAAGSLFTR